MLLATLWATGSPQPRYWSNSWVFSGMPSTQSTFASRDRQRWYARVPGDDREPPPARAAMMSSSAFHSFWPFASEVRRIVDDGPAIRPDSRL